MTKKKWVQNSRYCLAKQRAIRRVLAAQPNIEFINDAAGEQFIVKIPRRVKLD